MAAAVAPRHVYKHRGTGPTGHCRAACVAGRPRRRQRPAGLEHCSNTVFDGLSNRTIRSGLSPSGLQGAGSRLRQLQVCEVDQTR